MRKGKAIFPLDSKSCDFSIKSKFSVGSKLLFFHSMQHDEEKHYVLARFIAVNLNLSLQNIYENRQRW